MFYDDEEIIENLAYATFFYCLIVYILIIIVFNKIIPKIKLKHEIKQEENVKSISNAYNDILEINKKYNFEKIPSNKINIFKEEFYPRNYYKANAIKIVRYNIENNINNIRDIIKKAIKNKVLYEKYVDECTKINRNIEDELIDTIGINKEKFRKSEDKLLEKNTISEEIYNIFVDVIISYSSPRGRRNYSRNQIVSFEELEMLYNEWLNGKKYEITTEIERSKMTDNLRYNVLKRDNFTCVLCGVSSKDGAKLHVDHIIPIAKGGKTVMSNLQTLCDRCNIGKSDITDENTYCPLCGSTLVERGSGSDRFLGCSNYPKCHYIGKK